jgi:hypothetical protein
VLGCKAGDGVPVLTSNMTILIRLQRLALASLSLSSILISAAACTTAETVPQGSVGADGMKVCASEQEQLRMQAYIDDLYDRRFVRATFASGSDQIDRIDFDKQPGCQNPDAHCPATPPAPPPPPAPPAGAGAIDTSLVQPTSVSCPVNTIPIMRPRIENLRHFCTLEDYFRK